MTSLLARQKVSAAAGFAGGDLFAAPLSRFCGEGAKNAANSVNSVGFRKKQQLQLILHGQTQCSKVGKRGVDSPLSPMMSSLNKWS